MRLVCLRTTLAPSLATALGVWSAQTIEHAAATPDRVALEDSEASIPFLSADSSTVYVTSRFAGDMNDFGYVYAIAAQPRSRDAGDPATTRFAQHEEE